MGSTDRLKLAAADRWLLRSLGRAGVWGLAYAMADFSGIAFGLIMPTALAEAVDAVVAGVGRDAVFRLLFVVMLAVGVGAVGSIAGTMSSTRIEASLRQELARAALGMSVARRRTFPVGDLASRLVASTQEAAGTVLGAFEVCTTILSAMVAAVILATMDWTLVVAVIVVAPATVVIARRLVSESSDLFASYQRVQGRIAALLSEAMSGIRTVRSAGTAAREADRVLAPVPELSGIGHALWGVQRGRVWQFSLLMVLAGLVVMAVAGWNVAEGRLTPGQFLAASAYSGMVLGAFGQIDSIMEIAYGRGSARRLIEVLDASVSAVPAERELPAGGGEITFTDVQARLGERLVLDRLDLVIPAGNLLAVVGVSGAGKSVLVQLVGGLIVPDSGNVQIDGCDVASLTDSALRAAVAYAFERPHLLGATIREAIAYGSDRADMASVEASACTAHADQFIRRLPDGYDTRLDRAPLSGGETQRLGLARALFADARILVLDDATSSLDTVTEFEVTEAITHAMAGRTRLVAAHRASTAARADLVAWLDHGRVRALAPHATLWADAEYRALFAAAVSAAEEDVL
jgi:ATP-binding cassette subfamily B protein